MPVSRTRLGRYRSTTVSTEAHEMVLEAFEAAISPAGPNPLHHRVEHAIQMTALGDVTVLSGDVLDATPDEAAGSLGGAD